MEEDNWGACGRETYASWLNKPQMNRRGGRSGGGLECWGLPAAGSPIRAAQKSGKRPATPPLPQPCPGLPPRAAHMTWKLNYNHLWGALLPSVGAGKRRTHEAARAATADPGMTAVRRCPVRQARPWPPGLAVPAPQQATAAAAAATNVGPLLPCRRSHHAADPAAARSQQPPAQGPSSQQPHARLHQHLPAPPWQPPLPLPLPRGHRYIAARPK